MSQQLWLRLYSRAVDNAKLGVLAPSDRWYYIALLCCKAQGILDSGDSYELLKRKISTKLHLTLKELDDLLARLQEVTLVTSLLQPTGWDDKQFVTDKLTYNADKQKKYRNRYKTLRNAAVTCYRPEAETETDTETDKVKTPMPSPAVSVPYAAIVNLYHNILENHPRVRKLTPARKSAIKQRHLQDMESSLEEWESYFRMVGRSDFLAGKTQPRDGRKVFYADLEWITKQGNFVKIYEGRYHGKI